MDQENSVGQSPSWFITFSDMMALLLTFFIMVVSFSELKSEEKYQALMDGFQQQFGTSDTEAELAPGQIRRRNTNLSKLVTAGRQQRESLLNFKTQVLDSHEDTISLSARRSLPKINVGTVLYFHEDQIELDESQRSLLRQQADGLRGKPYRVEIRGQSFYRSSPPGATVRDHWELSFERCRRVMQYLVEEQQIDSRRLRILTTAGSETQPEGTAKSDLQRDSRVELLLLDESVHDTNSG